jgi:hypothetical protein
MKRYLILFALMFSTGLAQAQEDLFQKYSGQDGVSTVYISKTMFEMIPIVESIGLNLVNMKGKISSIQMLSTERPSLAQKMHQETSKMVGKQHEELMRITEGPKKTTFYIKKKGETIRELLMISDANDGFSLILLTGEFTLKEIQEITSAQTEAQ